MSRKLEPLKAFSGDVWGFKHLLTRYLNVWGKQCYVHQIQHIEKKHYVIVASLPDIFFRVKCQMYIFCCASLGPTDVKVKNNFVVPNLIFHTPVHLKATTHSIRSSFLTTRGHPASTEYIRIPYRIPRQLHLSRSQVCCFSAPCLVKQPLDHENGLKRRRKSLLQQLHSATSLADGFSGHHPRCCLLGFL